MKAWQEMTEKEREEYINQDWTKRHWREDLEVDNPGYYGSLIHKVSLSDAVTDEYKHEMESILSKKLTPFERVVFYEYFIHRKRIQQVADGLVIVYRVDGIDQYSKQATYGMINNQIRQIRKKLEMELEDLEKKHLEFTFGPDGLITADYLRSIMHYNDEDGSFVWKVCRSKGVKPGDLVTSFNVKGYKAIELFNKTYYLHRLAWLYCYGEWPDVIDHVNMVRSDNRIENLENVTHGENLKRAIDFKKTLSNDKKTQLIEDTISNT